MSLSPTTGTLSIALSGIEAAEQRIGTASHNVANLLTDDFHPLRTTQSARASGGVSTRTERSEDPAEVSLAHELVGAELASVQARASLRVADVELDLLGRLIDLHA
ncbi:MAG: flagellar basal body rod protein [Myxococcota bacterium]